MKVLFVWWILGSTAFGAVAQDPAALSPYQNRWGRARPLVAVAAQNRYTETTDFLIPYGVLKESGAADVVAVSMAAGSVELFPALTVLADLTREQFDLRHPEGADYVIVPAVHESRDPVLLGWIASQAAKGAVVVGVCDGVLTVAAAGLLQGKRATGHWYSLPSLEARYPETNWVTDRRFVEDGRVVTTTGVTASIPVSLALVEAMAGPVQAAQTARVLGFEGWSATHDSRAFQKTGLDYLLLTGNTLAFWGHEALGIRVATGTDDIALALTADAWSRTYRSQAHSMAPAAGNLLTRHGLTLVPDRWDSDGGPALRLTLPLESRSAGRTLNGVLQDIAKVYGEPTASLVAVQEEYPGGPFGRP